MDGHAGAQPEPAGRFAHLVSEVGSMAPPLAPPAAPAAAALRDRLSALYGTGTPPIEEGSEQGAAAAERSPRAFPKERWFPSRTSLVEVESQCFDQARVGSLLSSGASLTLESQHG